MPFEGVPRAEKAEKPRIEDTERTYQLESGITVEVKARKFSAENREREGRNTIFLPGWAMSADTKGIEKLCETFSERSGADTYALTTRSEERGKGIDQGELLYEEAKAVKLFLKENNLKEVTIAGYSQGGDKAVDLVSLLQEDPDVSINGLVLIDSVGLYDQGGIELAAKFTKNATLDTTESVATALAHGKNVVSPALHAGEDISKNILREVGRSGTGYLARFKSEVSEMAERNPRTSSIHVPIVVVNGMNDSVSDAERIAPSGEVDPLKKELGEITLEEATTEEPARDKTLAAREQYLQENLFEGSPYVRMLVPEKLGVHALPMLRPESVAKTSLYMLERYQRTLREQES